MLCCSVLSAQCLVLSAQVSAQWAQSFAPQCSVLVSLPLSALKDVCLVLGKALPLATSFLISASLSCLNLSTLTLTAR